MRLRKLKIKYQTGGFATSGQVGLPNITPVYDTPLIEKDKGARFSNVIQTGLKGAKIGSSVGAGIGSVVAPGLGTAIGGLGGAITGFYGGVATGLFTNRKEEKKRQQTNRELTALNEQKKQANIDLWKQYAGAEDTMNINAAKAAGYNQMGNADQEFYGAYGGILKYAGGGLSRSEDYGSSDKPYPSVSSGSFAGGNRSYPIPTKADAVDALRLAGLHGRSDVKAKVFAKYPGLKHRFGGLASYQEGGTTPPVKPRQVAEKDYLGNWVRALSPEERALNESRIKNRATSNKRLDTYIATVPVKEEIRRMGGIVSYQGGGETPIKDVTGSAFNTTPPKTLKKVTVVKPIAPKKSPASEVPSASLNLGGGQSLKLSAAENKRLQQFSNNPALRKQAISEMVGFDNRSMGKPGTEGYAKNVHLQNIAYRTFNEGYNPLRDTPIPIAEKAYSEANIANYIDPTRGTTTTKKTEEFLSGHGDQPVFKEEEQLLNPENKALLQEVGSQTKSLNTGPQYTEDVQREMNKRRGGRVEYGFKKGGRLNYGFNRGGTTYKDGGQLEGLSNNTQLAQGQTHEQGGIQLTPQAEIEGGETVTDKGDHYFIASDKLKNPLTGNTFAKDDATISKKIGKLEDTADTTASRNSLKLLNMKKSKIAQIQQSMNGDSTGQAQMPGGGTTPKQPDSFEKYRAMKDRRDLINAGEDPEQFEATFQSVLKEERERNQLDSLIRSNKEEIKQQNRKEALQKNFFNLGGESWKKRQSANRPYETLQIPPVQNTYFNMGGRYKAEDGMNLGKPIDIGYNPGSTYTLGAVGRPATTYTPNFNFVPNLAQSNQSPRALQIENPEETLTPISRTKYPGQAPAFTPASTGGGVAGFLGGEKGQALMGAAKTVGQGIANYGLAALEYKNQKKAIDKLRKLDIPQPILSGYANLGRANLGAERAEVDKQIAAANRGVDLGLSDSNVAAGVKAGNLAQSLASKAGISERERNANMAIANQQQQFNLQTQGANNAAIQARQKAEFDKQAQLIGMSSEAYSKLMENIRGGQNVSRTGKYVQNQLALDAYGLPSAERGAFFNYMKNQGRGVGGGGMNLPNYRRGGRMSKMYC